jgi:anti-sigma regulatory factor (Ser/Thr protein kinase)
MRAEFRARFPCSYRSVVEARHGLLHYVRTFGFAESVVADIECAIGEALANAAEHGFRDGTTFDVLARSDGESLVIEVQDDGPGFPHASAASAPLQPPATGSPRGFGMFIMRSLMDEIAYTDRGRRITLKKRLPVAGNGANDEDTPGEDATALG